MAVTPLTVHLSEEANKILLEMVEDGFTKRGAVEHLLLTRRNKVQLTGCERCGLIKERKHMVKMKSFYYCHNCDELLGHAGVIDPVKESEDDE